MKISRTSLQLCGRLNPVGEAVHALVETNLPRNSQLETRPDSGDLLGGLPRSTVYKLKSAAGTLRQDELMRISYLIGIYKALHIILPDDLADLWITRPNDNLLFRGQPPLDYMIRTGILGLQQVRSLLDAQRSGH